MRLVKKWKKKDLVFFFFKKIRLYFLIMIKESEEVLSRVLHAQVCGAGINL
jgi:hypothetical protein